MGENIGKCFKGREGGRGAFLATEWGMRQTRGIASVPAPLRGMGEACNPCLPNENEAQVGSRAKSIPQ